MIDQLMIAVLGPTALWCTQTERLQKYACFIGLSAAPFWFYATWSAGQWGMFLINFLYLGAWLKGVWSYWIEPWRTEREQQSTERGYDMLEGQRR